MVSTIRLSRAVSELAPSGIRRFFDLVAARPQVISLGVGEPDFVTPWSIREAGIWSLEKGATSYTGNRGLPQTLDAIATYLRERYGVEYRRDELIVTVGASQAIDIALRAILDPGDEVIVIDPSYVCYEALVHMAGGVPVPVAVDPERGYCPNPDAVLAAVSPRTKALFLNYPNNPTGATYAPELLEQLAAIARAHGLTVISDEIYSELTYEGQHLCFAAIPGMRERTILVSGFSKAFAMTGWRLGYIAAPPEASAAMLKIHQYAMLCAPITAQLAAIDALKRLETDVRDMRESYNRRRLILAGALNEAGLKTPVPRGAFYCFADVRHTGMDDVAFCERLLEEQEVAMVPGSAFGRGGRGFIRGSFATAEAKLIEAGRRIKAFTAGLGA
ncbi:aminotransferase class I/II-fold pyridoxal phosphate-dependent enzyme [Candidatus Poribacteria bacterium]|nr:aminotransferase class I/II-fold pyridoxal phosphate-dependent enzyme [Candidatus Poribacteria bacterium]